MRRATERLASRLRWPILAWMPMLVWFAAFRPGIMSADSLESWRQATTGGWIDVQPPIYTAAMWLSHVLVDSPSLLTLAQSLLLATSIVSVGRSLARFGVPRGFVVAACGLVVCTPMVGAFAVSLWKDIPFTAALLFMLAHVIELARARIEGDHADDRAQLRGVVLWAMLAVSLRQNGVLIVAVLLAVLWLALAGLRRWVAGGLAAAFGVVLLAKFVAYPLLDVHPGPENSNVSTFLHDVGAVAAGDPAALDADDRRLLERVAPIEVWGAVWNRFGCTSANWQYDPAFDWARLGGHQREVVELWVELLTENPRAVGRNRICVGAVAWRPDSHGVLYTVSRGVDVNDLGLRTVPIVRDWHGAAVDVLDALDSDGVQPFVWRAPSWLYLTYFTVGLAAWRRRLPALLLPLAVPAALQLSVAVLNAAQDARYLMPGLISAWLLLPLAAVRPASAPDRSERGHLEHREAQVRRPEPTPESRHRSLQGDPGRRPVR